MGIRWHGEWELGRNWVAWGVGIRWGLGGMGSGN